MNDHACGCTTETCGCCEGTQKLTPAPVANRPALPVLAYRVGTHAQFFETMKARLSTMPVEGIGADGQTMETFRPLDGLTTRDPGDPAIALLDGWATVADVLTFYQERIANEGYLRTATERRSVLELARLVGYALRPGVASTVYLAYTLEDKQVEPGEIPAGARSQSIPGPGESPQAFETSENLTARTTWNNLQVRLNQPQVVTVATVLAIPSLYVNGTNVNLHKGDRLLFIFGSAPRRHAQRIVERVEADFNGGRSVIYFQPVMAGVAEGLPLLLELMERLALQTGTNAQVLQEAESMLRENLMEAYTDPSTWPDRVGNDPTFTAAVAATLKLLGVQSSNVTEPSKFVTGLLKKPIPQAVGGLRLQRSFDDTFQPNTDVLSQLLVNFAPELKDTYYAAWRNANVNAAQSPLEGVFAFRASAALFGATVPKQPAYYNDDAPQTTDPQIRARPRATSDAPGDPDQAHVRGQLKPQSEWYEWPYEADERDDNLFLDQAHEDIAIASYVMLRSGDLDQARWRVFQVKNTLTRPRSAYGTGGQTTLLTLDSVWRKTGDASDQKKRLKITALRETQVLTQSEALTLAEVPITEPVSGAAIKLDSLYEELSSGRRVIFSGERADLEGVSGVKASELLMISGLQHGYDENLPGDKTHTTLILATPTAYQYKRDTLVIYGNVVKATHGETRNEVLGSGDGAQSLQAFSLRQPPLTFVPAPTAAGAASTLRLLVNEVEWHETGSLAGLAPRDRKFVSQTDDAGATSIIFGDGEQGARLPTGVENVKAVYRNGIGKAGNVQAEQISLLQTRPLGVKGVINPLPASGGADKEGRDLARENAPLSVMALDRLVGVQDYADFTRTFAGIGKAAARRMSDGHREIVYVTIAGADDIPIDPVSDLYQNLLAALRRLGDPGMPVRMDSRELIALALSAMVKLLPDYQWEPVATEIRARLLETFGFQNRALGQPALLCEAISAIQNVRGVAFVDVDAFGGIPEKKAEDHGARRLLTQEEIADTVAKILHPAPRDPKAPSPRVDVATAGIEKGVLRPAQLAIFKPAVPDTLILNQKL